MRGFGVLHDATKEMSFSSSSICGALLVKFAAILAICVGFSQDIKTRKFSTKEEALFWKVCSYSGSLCQIFHRVEIRKFSIEDDE